jgi:putative RNA 2'-phosphotransferase
MTHRNELTTISKFLSYVLRHHPQSIGLVLDDAGWAGVDDLLAQAGTHGRRITRELLNEVVRSNDKQRFAFSDDGQRIRASQGHSLDVELGLQPAAPPPLLYHGTAQRFIESIMQSGLDKRNRHHVHLTADVVLAMAVGQRYGSPVLLEVDAGRMHGDGQVFYRSANGVWLVDHVAPHYLKVRR